MPLKNKTVFLVFEEIFKGSKTLLNKVGEFDTLDEAEKETGFILTSKLDVGDYHYFIVKAHRIY
jgi:hypothetical protein